MKEIKDLVKNSAYAQFILMALREDPHQDHVLEEIGNMKEASDKSDWMAKHPLVELSGLTSKETPNTSFAAISPKVKEMLKGIVQMPQGSTVSLIDKLSLNPDFVRIFTINPSFQKASLVALQMFNQSITLGTTNESKRQNE